ncbi:phosphate/phosphite/phosphonate ABC transporter substrate-binding protein [Ignavibacterium album]|uniref:substrate-binding domain-containing protein n=1 Tax=Ignavibacterium album TaxID=591197 RepID=UPI0026EFA183|nr:phosphate/phosphite/phosphonate ABC transporter substrate-binding protein [Ignavibacterium album]
MKKNSLLIFITAITLIACADNPKIKEIEFSNYHKSEDHQHRKDSIPVIYVAVSTMISPMETFNLYKDVMDYISKHLGIQIEFKQRKTYREVNDLLAENKLDFAFICTGAYLEARNEIPIEILAVPVVNGKPYYQAYVIANEESQISEINQLKGKSFAFTDPLSNTGYSYIINYLKEKNTSPERFFSKTIFTYAHDYSIQAVKRKIVDGATVDGLVFEYLKHFQPEKIAGVKVILKSREFGIPPFVIQKNLDNNIKQKLRSVMLNMHNDPEGKKLLSKIMIDKFILADDSIYR